MDGYRTLGQYVEALLEQRGWSQRVLAIVLGIDPAILTKIISGKRRIDAELAIAFGEAFGIEAERFLDIQKAHELERARIETAPNRARASRAAIFADLPIPEMVRRGWLDVQDMRDVARVEAELAKFFSVEGSETLEILPHAAKKTETETPVTPAQLAWIYRVKQIASEMLVPKYSATALRRAVETLKSLLLSAEEARKVPRILAEVGVRFVMVESLKSSKIDGVCLWLDDNSPVIGLSLRFDRIDNFWFVLRHEIEHVLRLNGSSAAVLDVDLENETDSVTEQERLANQAAAEFCIPAKQMESLIARKSPLFAERDVIAFAKMQQVHPGIVAGQLQRRTRRYELMRQHLVKIRSIVSPGAMVDGWGDVAPVGI